ncbi:Uncharacterized alpha/beta hydrolase domain (DUF2235) domain containing protein [Lactarius tabidus]
MWIKNKWASMTARHFKSNILSGYRFLSDKYDIGDQIFLLGFSRGAYQARVLAAMIKKVGLLRTGNNEQIPFAFKLYTDPEASKDIPMVSMNPGRRGGATSTTAKEFKRAFCHDVNIHFVGVWDTVSSVGAFRNKYYPEAERADNICFFRHALALDERRVKFIPEYVFAKKESFSAGEFRRPRCKEVWFRGYHSDVGGGHLENTTSDNGAIPSRWMVYEAMLAGLEMAPFWGGIKVDEDLVPNIGEDSMTPFYRLLEYLSIKWEVHSERHPPFLISDEETPPRYFSRACHRKLPRQIFNHQKLHASICLHGDLSGTPFARLPNSWVLQDGMQDGWTDVINLLRENDEAKYLIKSNTNIRSGPPSIAYFDFGNGGMSDQSEVVQNTSPGEVFTDPTFRVPSPPILRSLVPSSISSPVPSPVSYPAPLRALLPVSSVAVVPEFRLLAEAVEWDLLDLDSIPALIGGVLRGTNVDVFLERLEVLAHLNIGKVMMIQMGNGYQFSSMIRQVCGDDKKYADHTGSAIRVAYEVFWHSDVDLYDRNTELWKIIHSKVESWNELRTAAPASSLQRAVRLLHKTESGQFGN